MVMCFYSLMSSMHTNIHEQAKEIGVLRAVGMRQNALRRLYVWEAFVLVLSASVMGMVVGTLVAYTMTIQQQLFTEIPTPFVLPWSLMITVFIMAMVCATFSALLPITFLLKTHTTVEILRRLMA
eukprot:PhM_4_TR7943/c0_g1_i1/m.53666